jgi:hypothetical protein
MGGLLYAFFTFCSLWQCICHVVRYETAFIWKGNALGIVIRASDRVGHALHYASGVMWW